MSPRLVKGGVLADVSYQTWIRYFEQVALTFGQGNGAWENIEPLGPGLLFPGRTD